MTFIKPTVEFIEAKDAEKHLEFCGRVCYNSANAIKEGSSSAFIKGVISRGHTSVLEHTSTVIVLSRLSLETKDKVIALNSTRYARVKMIGSEVFIAGNLRAFYNIILEMKETMPDLAQAIQSKLSAIAPTIFEPTVCKSYASQIFESTTHVINDLNFTDFNEDFQKWYKENHYYTFKIVCSRACHTQLIRHREASFSVQSQRYCNYASDKFGKDIKFVTALEGNETIRKQCEEAEASYFKLIDNGVKPEDAREVLPNATATIIMMSAPKWEWDKIFALRCDSHAQAEVRSLCNSIKEIVDTRDESLGSK